MRAAAASAIAVACGTPTPSTPRVVQAAPGPDADEHAGGAGAHQVQRRLVARAAADDRRDRLARDELLEVERLDHRRDVLGGDDRALDDEDVEPRLERDRVVLAHPLRRERGGGEHARGLDLLDALRDQLGLDRLRVELLHELRRLAGRRLRDALELLVGVRVARPDALEVEHREAAELADLDRDRRRDDAVHRRGEQRQLEQVGPELPADVDILGVARAPARHDRDVIEPVGASRLLAPPDLDLHRVGSLRSLGLSTTRPRGACGTGLGLGRSARLDVECPTSADASKGVGPCPAESPP